MDTSLWTKSSSNSQYFCPVPLQNQTLVTHHNHKIMCTRKDHAIVNGDLANAHMFQHSLNQLALIHWPLLVQMVKLLQFCNQILHLCCNQIVLKETSGGRLRHMWSCDRYYNIWFPPTLSPRTVVMDCSYIGILLTTLFKRLSRSVCLIYKRPKLSKFPSMNSSWAPTLWVLDLNRSNMPLSFNKKICFLQYQAVRLQYIVFLPGMSLEFLQAYSECLLKVFKYKEEWTSLSTGPTLQESTCISHYGSY